MKYKYKSIDTRTMRGIKIAEKLRAKGWEVVSVGATHIVFQKETL